MICKENYSDGNVTLSDVTNLRGIPVVKHLYPIMIAAVRITLQFIMKDFYISDFLISPFHAGVPATLAGIPALLRASAKRIDTPERRI